MFTKNSNKGKETRLIDLFGLISEKDGNELMNDLKKIKEMDIKLMKRVFLELKI